MTSILNSSIMLYISYGLMVVLTNMSIRFIGDDIPAFEKVFFRSLISFILISTFILNGKRKKEPLTFATKAPLWQLLRAICGVGGLTTLFYALEKTHLTLVTSIQFLNPLIVTILSALLLREKVHIRRWIAVLVGIMGVFITLGFSKDIGIGAISALIS